MTPNTIQNRGGSAIQVYGDRQPTPAPQFRPGAVSNGWSVTLDDGSVGRSDASDGLRFLALGPCDDDDPETVRAVAEAEAEFAAGESVVGEELRRRRNG
jgi:hypothetical protein